MLIALLLLVFLIATFTLTGIAIDTYSNKVRNVCMASLIVIAGACSVIINKI
jgi:uncharacterized membrane protein